jgi:hypothetical protein
MLGARHSVALMGRRHLRKSATEWRAPGKDYFQGSATFGQNGVLRLV